MYIHTYVCVCISLSLSLYIYIYVYICTYVHTKLSMVKTGYWRWSSDRGAIVSAGGRALWACTRQHPVLPPSKRLGAFLPAFVSTEVDAIGIGLEVGARVDRRGAEGEESGVASRSARAGATPDIARWRGAPFGALSFSPAPAWPQEEGPGVARQRGSERRGPEEEEEARPRSAGKTSR